MNTAVLNNKIILKKYSILDTVELVLRVWMGQLLIRNSGVGTITPLESLGMPDHIYTIMKGMWDTGFMMHLVKLTELIGGIMLISNFFVPIALLALIPVVINIYGVHIFLFNGYITSGLYMLLICGFLVYRHRDVYLPLFKRK
ncbi:MAG: DoxX family membrane protein [Bacteriovoracaceae bacterium]|nr:DoxX family membrane protein [Bacteriovoracaceae bacterium]